MSLRRWGAIAVTGALLTSCGVVKGDHAARGRPLIEDVTQVLLGHHGNAAAADTALTRLLDAERDSFTAHDWKVRATFEAMSVQVAQWTSSQASTVHSTAQQIAGAVSPAGFPAAGRATLADITEDAATGIGCSTVHSVAFAATAPARASADGTWNLPGDELVDAARRALGAGYSGAAEIDWAQWSVDVRRLGGQSYAALLANELPNSSLLDRPEVQRAALAYFRRCLAPPVPLD